MVSTDDPVEPGKAAKGNLSDLQDSTVDFAGSRFFERLIRSLPGLFYLVDPDSKVLSWNKNLELVTGYSRTEITAKTLSELLFIGEDRRRIEQATQEVFVKGESVAEAEISTKAGRKVPYFLTGVRAAIGGRPYAVGVGIDLSELKQRENDLRESEALYRRLADLMTAGVMLYDHSRIIFANRAWASLLGFVEPSALIGKALGDLFSGQFAKSLQEIFESLDGERRRERGFEARWLTTTGREIWIDGHASLIRWQNFPAVFLTARDITDAKRREKMQEEAEHLRMKENIKLRSSIRKRHHLGEIIGGSAPMQEVYELILDAAATTANVILYGESGTGKDLVARAIHEMSRRASGPFVPVNCAAIPEPLLESEFFGHKKGAFTDARADKAGYLDSANGGTLFLDEVGDLRLALQAKLLRAIEGGGYLPVGSTVTRSSDFRIVAATHRNLLEEVKNERVREDFFYRIHVIPIRLPALRQRREDIPLLLEHFLNVYSDEESRPSIPDHVMEALLRYDWPGNVRELQNAIQHYLAVKRLEFVPSFASEVTYAGTDPKVGPLKATENLRLVRNVEDTERAAIRQALDQCHWRKGEAAQLLGISRKTLFRKMKRLDLC